MHPHSLGLLLFHTHRWLHNTKRKLLHSTLSHDGKEHFHKKVSPSPGILTVVGLPSTGGGLAVRAYQDSLYPLGFVGIESGKGGWVF